MPKRYSFENAPFKTKYVRALPNSIFNYAKCSGLPENTPERIERYQKIENSILTDGFYNPISVVGGIQQLLNLQQLKPNLLPSEMAENPDEAVVCYSHGGTRLYFAQKHNIKIPCIVADFTNRFPNGKVIESVKELRGYFKSELKKCLITPTGLYVEEIGGI